MYQFANANDGTHTLAIRNADVPELVLNLSIGPGHWALPRNLAELSFAITLDLSICLTYFRAVANLAED